MRNVQKIKKQLLFCPGPVNLADNVKAAAIQADICHREKEFEDTFKRLQENVLKVLEIRQPRKYAAVFVTGSGTAGNETILASLGKNKRILVLSNGEFGERLVQIATIHHKQVNTLRFDWGTEMDIETIKKFIKTHKIDILMMVHHETSSGLLNPIEEVGKIAHSNNIQFIVDAVSSATAEKIDMENSHITFLNTTSGKAISSFPGIAIIVGKKTSFTALERIQPKIAYLNLYKFYHYATDLFQTPNTPGVQLFFALDQALQNIVKEGIEARRQRIERLATYLKKGMKEMGFEFLLSKNTSRVVTSVYLPKGMSFIKLQVFLRKKRIIVYNGKGPFKDKIFQVGHIGELSMKDAKYFLASLKEFVEDKKKKKHSHAFSQSLSKFPQAITALF